MDKVETLVKIGNDPTVMKAVEPNVAFHQTLQKWMVVRTLKALELLKKK